ncbi:hypothetical protein pb186bvf_009012 [Paramecium bursaria]
MYKDGIIIGLGFASLFFLHKWILNLKYQSLEKKLPKSEQKEPIRQDPKMLQQMKHEQTVGIFKVCLTGGPCGGKTSGLSYLTEKFRERGFDVYVVPEAATLIFQGGGMINLAQFSEEQIIQFQASLLRLQMALEHTFTSLAQIDRSKPTIIFCDRGLMDGSAYMEPQVWSQMLQDLELNEVMIRDKRYDLVVHLVTAADGAEQYYSKDNAARHEGLENAIQQDRKTQSAWIGHPNFKIIDNQKQDEFVGKLKRLYNSVARSVGLAFEQSNEQKIYLLQCHNFDIQLPTNIKFQIFEIKKIYLEYNVQDGENIKLLRRKQGPQKVYIQKIKQVRGHKVLRQICSIINRKQYMIKKSSQNSPSIKMKRICFVYEGSYYKLDLIKGFGFLFAKDCQDQLPPILKVLLDTEHFELNADQYRETYWSYIKEGKIVPPNRKLSVDFGQNDGSEKQKIKQLQAGFFWGKGQQSQQKEQKDQKQPKEQWNGKEEYLKEIRQQREEYENLRIKQQKESKTQEQRQFRDYEVEYGRIDYAKIMVQNINILTTSEFQHPDELFNFIQSVKIKLTEENLMKCITSMINMSNKLTEEDLLRVEYYEFLHLLSINCRVLSKTNHILQLAQLLDLLCVDTEHQVWKEFEILLLRKIDTFKLGDFTRLLTHLSNQREGTDHFWDKCENYIKGLLEQEDQKDKLENTIQIFVSYWKVMKGTKPFAEFMVNILLKEYNKPDVVTNIDLNSIVQTMTVISNITKAQALDKPTQNIQFKQLFSTLESEITKRIDQLDLEQVCLVAQGFGFDYGSNQLLGKLESIILKDFDKYSIIELRSILKGFVFTYRGSKKLFSLLKNKVTALKHDLTINELVSIVKAFYITENDDQQFYTDIEKRVLGRLKEVKDISLLEIHDIVHSYTITRIGSRELYKLLEIVNITFIFQIINHRFDDIRQDAIILGKLYDYYSRSGLCDPDLLQRIGSFL